MKTEFKVTTRSKYRINYANSHLSSPTCWEQCTAEAIYYLRQMEPAYFHL